MKEFRKFRIVASVLAFIFALSLFGCKGNVVEYKGFNLGHFDGSNIENGYDTDLLYKNNTELWGGDAGVIWVSVEEGEELAQRGIVDENGESYGGYYYMYNTASRSQTYGAIFTDEQGEYSEWVVCTRSKDMCDWEMCGAVDSGMCLRAGASDWLGQYFWAPEVLYIPQDFKNEKGETAYYAGKYIMYFSCAYKDWTPEAGELGAIYESKYTGLGRMAVGIAIADSPVGPFNLVTSKNVYGNEQAKQPISEDYFGKPYTGMYDGVHEKGIVTSINPPIMLDLPIENEDGSVGRLVDEYFSMIDLSPYIDVDEDGNYKMYLYFSDHYKSTHDFNPANGECIWGVEMIDPITPLYSSMRMLVANGHGDVENGGDCPTTVTWKGEDVIANGSMTREQALSTYLVTNERSYIYPDKLENGKTLKQDAEDTGSGNDLYNDGNIAEAPNIIKSYDKDHNAVYLMTYSPRGVGFSFYDVKFAYSKNGPMGPYLKPSYSKSRILGIDDSTGYMTAMGHGMYIDTTGRKNRTPVTSEWTPLEDQIWFYHWESPERYNTFVNEGRIGAVSQLTWQYDDELGFYVPYANGPSKSLQPITSTFSSYKNVSHRAKVSVSSGNNETIKYLNDGMVVTSITRENCEFSFKKSTVITMELDQAVDVRGLLIYNSYNKDTAFGSVKGISFSLTEKPSWFNGEGDGLSCYIKNLGFTATNLGPDTKEVSTACTASIATFNEIKTNKIVIEIDSAYANNEEIRISEIVVLGK